MVLTGRGPGMRIFGMGRSNSCHFCENPLLNYPVKMKLTSKYKLNYLKNIIVVNFFSSRVKEIILLRLDFPEIAI